MLYGVAGLAHFLDLLVGVSALFASAGIPPYASLSSSAQAFALLWCASGPLAYALNRIDTQSHDRALQSTAQSNDRAAGLSLSDLGLVYYGLVEVLGAALAVIGGDSGEDVLMMAVGVQLVVLMAWLYSNNKETSPVKTSSVK